MQSKLAIIVSCALIVFTFSQTEDSADCKISKFSKDICCSFVSKASVSCSSNGMWKVPNSCSGIKVFNLKYYTRFNFFSFP